jgi:catechol 2,3-dioxygenase-like lactoylglutathione lyase family enzyme
MGGTLGLGPVGQVGILVRDLERAIAAYARVWPARFAVYTYGPHTLTTLAYRGAPGAFSMRIALSDTTPQIELIEARDGPSLYHEWLAEHGEGLHHVAVYVDSLDDAVAVMARAGHGVLQEGRGFGVDGDGGFAYFDTIDALDIVLEAIERPARRVTPEAVLP